MATGMFLKSTPEATDLSVPQPGGGLADFCRAMGERELTELTPIPCDVFVRYGMWFTDCFVGPVDERRVVNVEQGATGFRVRLEDGEQIEAGDVVVATGLRALAYVPGRLAWLAPQGVGPDAAVSHSSHHTDLSRYAGHRVAVIGGGQSALESAALLQEAGARAEVLVPAEKVRWGDTPVPQRPLAQRIAHPPASPLGPGWALTGVCTAPQAVRVLPATVRLWLVGRALGPSGAWWLRERVEGRVPVHTRRPVRHADFDNGTVCLVTGTDGAKQHEMKVDHVLAATGYRIDVDTLSFLCSALRPAIARVPGSAAPALSASLEASIPGLYFTGSLAAPLSDRCCGSWPAAILPPVPSPPVALIGARRADGPT